MNNTHSFFSRHYHFPISRLAALLLVALLGLAGSGPAFCGEIHDAARGGDLGKVKALLQGDPDLVFSKDNNGETPLHLASDQGHKDVAELLRQHGGQNPPIQIQPSPSAANGSGEIYDAAKRGDLARVQALLKDNPDLISSKDKNGLTPLHLAADQGHKDVVEFLLANKADVNARKGLNAPVVISGIDIRSVAGAGNGGAILTDGRVIPLDPLSSLAMVGALARRGLEDLDVDRTPLHMAAEAGHKDVAELLLAHNADVNARDKGGHTPLHMAAKAGHKDIAEVLLANRAEVNAKENGGDTPLHLAAMQGHKDVAEVLLANGADVNNKDRVGGTPLHDAAEWGHKDVAEVLVAHKAEVNAKDINGQTPLRKASSNHFGFTFSKAEKQGRKDVAELLRRHGGHE